jgi:hypothetical protein
MRSIHGVKECLCGCSSSEWVFKWNKMSKLGQLIHYYQDGVKHVGDWEPFNEVHPHCVPSLFRNWKWLELPGVADMLAFFAC